LSDEELTHQAKTTAEQLFRLRFQVSLGQNDGVKKLREMRREIAQIKTVARSASWAFAARRRCRRGRRQQEGSPLNDGDTRGSAGAGGRRRPAKREGWQVVSTKMQKTIVVEVEMRKAHPKYKRIVRSTKKFYAHDEQSSARMGDVVRIRETRPLSKLKRWSLEEIVRRSALGQLEDAAPNTAN